MSGPIKTGAVIIIIGRQGSGKTPTIKRLMEAGNFRSNVVLDIRHEYDETKYTVFYTYSGFKTYLPQIRGAFIVVEEATAFIASYKDLELTDMLIGVEHNKNTMVFAFHSCDDVPPYLLRFSRYIVLLDTNDDPEKVKRNRPKLFPYLSMKKPVIIDNYKPINQNGKQPQSGPGPSDAGAKKRNTSNAGSNKRAAEK